MRFYDCCDYFTTCYLGGPPGLYTIQTGGVVYGDQLPGHGYILQPQPYSGNPNQLVPLNQQLPYSNQQPLPYNNIQAVPYTNQQIPYNNQPELYSQQPGPYNNQQGPYNNQQGF